MVSTSDGTAMEALMTAKGTEPGCERKPARDDNGRVLPGGGSLNPGGRPKLIRDVQAELEKGSAEAAQKLVALVAHEDPKVAHAACIAVLDRVIGRPKERVEVKSNDVARLLAHMATGRRVDTEETEGGDE